MESTFTAQNHRILRKLHLYHVDDEYNDDAYANDDGAQPREASSHQKRSFLFNIVQKVCCKFCIILKAFWQHKFDIKRLFKGDMSQIKGKIVLILG